MNLDLDYRPRDPKRFRPGIGIIGCGGIVASHLAGYAKGNYRVVALADPNEANLAEKAKLVPGAQTFTDHRQLLALPDVEVCDIATHPRPRVALIRDALNAGRHVLSQKPFVLDLEVGEELVRLARRKRVKLAVNQNGRYSPAWRYSHLAIQAGLIGEVTSVHLRCHWNHDWVAERPFNRIHHVILYDFAIHWFDILTAWMGEREPRRVFASVSHAPGQRATPPLLGQALVEYEGAQATLVFDAHQTAGGEFSFFIGGTKGSIAASGPDLNSKPLELRLPDGAYRPRLDGAWFPDGFHGTMGELLCAIEERREPWNNAKDNLRSLRTCFAACLSADRGKPVDPRTVKRLPKGNEAE